MINPKTMFIGRSKARRWRVIDRWFNASLLVAAIVIISLGVLS